MDRAVGCQGRTSAFRAVFTNRLLTSRPAFHPQAKVWRRATTFEKGRSNYFATGIPEIGNLGPGNVTFFIMLVRRTASVCHSHDAMHVRVLALRLPMLFVVYVRSATLPLRSQS